MANDFMKNANKISLDGEVVSFSDTLPKVDVEVKEVVTEASIVEKAKEEKIETKEENVNNEETAESTEETVVENVDEEKVEE